MSVKAGQQHARDGNPLDQSVILEMRIGKSRAEKLKAAQEHVPSVREFLRGELMKCSRTTLTKSHRLHVQDRFHTEYFDLVLS